MARAPTPKQLNDTLGQPDQTALLAAMKAMDAKATAIDSRSAHIEMMIGQLMARQADAEKRQDIRITEKLVPLSIRGITAAERVIEVLESLPGQIEQAGHKASQQMAHNSLQAKRLMEGVETAAFVRMQEMRDTAVRIATEAQASMTKTIETIRDEASILMRGMHNAAVGDVGGLGAEAVRKLKQVGDQAAGLIQTTADTARDDIRRTANTVADGFQTATVDAKNLAELNVSAMKTFETCMASLKQIGGHLSETIERRTWQITRATGFHTAVSIGLGAAVYHSVLWILSTHY